MTTPAEFKEGNLDLDVTIAHVRAIVAVHGPEDAVARVQSDIAGWSYQGRTALTALALVRLAAEPPATPPRWRRPRWLGGRTK